MQTLYLTLFIFSFLFSAISVAFLLPLLKRMAKQPIYTDGPKWHIKKEGTPTMGGIGFMVPIFLCLLFFIVFHKRFFSAQESSIILINTLFILFNGFIGIYDDLKKIKQKQNEGLTPKEKLIYQTILCILYLFARAKLTGLSTSITIFGNVLSLGVLFYPLALFVMVGMINCANLTDGIDGLASTVGFSIGVAFFLMTLSEFGSASLLSVLMMGGTLGFLLFNRHPAKIFMGDCGSLSLGAICICISFSLNNPFLILLVGGIYVIEGFSVVIQVLHYKRTKKRLFRMAPIHHHLEMIGMKEKNICILAIIGTFLLSILAYLTL